VWSGGEGEKQGDTKKVKNKSHWGSRAQERPYMVSIPRWGGAEKGERKTEEETNSDPTMQGMNSARKSTS